MEEYERFRRNEESKYDREDVVIVNEIVSNIMNNFNNYSRLSLEQNQATFESHKKSMKLFTDLKFSKIKFINYTDDQYFIVVEYEYNSNKTVLNDKIFIIFNKPDDIELEDINLNYVDVINKIRSTSGITDTELEIKISNIYFHNVRMENEKSKKYKIVDIFQNYNCDLDNEETKKVCDTYVENFKKYIESNFSTPVDMEKDTLNNLQIYYSSYDYKTNIVRDTECALFFAIPKEEDIGTPFLYFKEEDFLENPSFKNMSELGFYKKGKGDRSLNSCRLKEEFKSNIMEPFYNASSGHALQNSNSINLCQTKFNDSSIKNVTIFDSNQFNLDFNLDIKSLSDTDSNLSLFKLKTNDASEDVNINYDFENNGLKIKFGDDSTTYFVDLHEKLLQQNLRYNF